MRPYGESFAVGGSNCHEFSHGGAEFRQGFNDLRGTLEGIEHQAIGSN